MCELNPKVNLREKLFNLQRKSAKYVDANVNADAKIYRKNLVYFAELYVILHPNLHIYLEISICICKFTPFIASQYNALRR